MRCVILCGGNGSRLMPLTKTTKKAYLPLGRKRVIDHIIDRLPRGLPYSISMNNDGALAALAEAAQGDEPVMVVCGDNYFSESLKDFVTAANGATLVGIYDLHDIERAKQHGVVSLYPNGQIRSLIEKPQLPETTLVSTGLYVFPPRVFPYIAERAAREPKGNLGNAIIHIMKFEPVYGFPIRGACFDIGTHQGYAAAIRFESVRLTTTTQMTWEGQHRLQSV